MIKCSDPLSNGASGVARRRMKVEGLPQTLKGLESKHQIFYVYNHITFLSYNALKPNNDLSCWRWGIKPPGLGDHFQVWRCGICFTCQRWLLMLTWENYNCLIFTLWFSLKTPSLSCRRNPKWLEWFTNNRYKWRLWVVCFVIKPNRRYSAIHVNTAICLFKGVFNHPCDKKFLG